MQTATLLWHWLLTPLSGSAVHELAPLVSWHGRTMVLAWGVLLPIGVVVARFFKVLPQQDWPAQLDRKVWWHVHLSSQTLGVLLAFIGLALIYSAAKNPLHALADTHSNAGWVVMVLAVVQAFGGLMRGSKGGPTDVQLRGDHYDLTRWRKGFEWLHKCAGYFALILGVVSIVLGLIVSDAPRWMPIALAAWWLGLLFVFYTLQQRGHCMDTYQAIWGPDTAHPGNAVPAKGWGWGWGSRRYTAHTFKRNFGTAHKNKELS